MVYQKLPGIYRKSEKSALKYQQEGYKKNSPHVNNAFNVIKGEGGRTDITMNEDDGSPLEKGALLAVDDKGKKTRLHPGKNYSFASDYIVESPITYNIGEAMVQGYQSSLSAADRAAGATQVIDGVACDAYGTPVGPSNPSLSKADYSQPKL